MPQFDFGTMDPDLTDGTELASILNQWRDAVNSAHKGPSAPTYAKVGMCWIDDSATPWALKRCTAVTPSVAWVVTGYINPTGPTFTPATHTHDDRYFTETEADGRFARSLSANGNNLELKTQTGTLLNAITAPYATSAGTAAVATTAKYA